MVRRWLRRAGHPLDLPAPDAARRGELLVGISCGGAWVCPDAGANWELQADGMRAADMPPEQAESPNTQDPHRIVRCPAQPDVLWCQHHNGIWRSGDNATSWQEITTAPLANFGFGVAVHPDYADTAWFVPGVADQQRIPVGGALVVNRARDGGRSFETLRTCGRATMAAIAGRWCRRTCRRSTPRGSADPAFPHPSVANCAHLAPRTWGRPPCEGCPVTHRG